MWSAQAVRDSKIDHTNRHLTYPPCAEPEARNTAVGWRHWNKQEQISLTVFIHIDVRQVLTWSHLLYFQWTLSQTLNYCSNNVCGSATANTDDGSL